jgi:hypothetical protein
MSTEKLKEEKKPYTLPLALKLAAEKAKKHQPELIAISGKLRYVHHESR